MGNGWRSARGLETGDFVIRSGETLEGQIRFNILRCEAGCMRRGVRPANCGYGAAALLMATAGAADDELTRFRRRRVVAAMNSFAQAAGVRGSSRIGCQGDRGEVSREREEQKESGDQTRHAGPEIIGAYQLTRLKAIMR